MEFRVSGDGLDLIKFVVTSFIDFPARGEITHHAEVIGATPLEFEIYARDASGFASTVDRYSDGTVCDRLYARYEKVGGAGRHIQSVGDERVSVRPVVATLSEVSAQADHPDEKGYHVSVVCSECEEGESAGTWLSWKQPYKTSGGSRESFPFDYHAAFERIGVRNFYSFIVLPDGYRASERSCQVAELDGGLGAAKYQPTLSEIEVGPQQFPIFPDWRPIFHGRKILKNRDGIALEASTAQNVELHATLQSDKMGARLLTSSYIVGVAIGVVGGLFANSLWDLVGTLNWEAGDVAWCSGAVMAVVSLLGWKILR